MHRVSTECPAERPGPHGLASGPAATGRQPLGSGAGRRPARDRPAIRALSFVVLAIPFVYLLVASVGPLIDQAVGSFFNWYAVHPQSFAGFRYYGQVLADPAARAALVHTAIYVVITVPVELVLGVGGAWLILRAGRGRAVLTTLYVLPLVIPWPTAAQLFSGMVGFNGVFDAVRSFVFGDTSVLFWNLDPKLSFAVIVAAGIWKGAPWVFLLMLAAFRACPPELFEAGRVDGARGSLYWRHVVIPAVWPMLVFVTVFRLFAEAQAAQSVDLLTQGGPFGATQLVATYANNLAFTYLDFPRSEALATLAGALLLVIALVGLAFVRRPTFAHFGRVRQLDRPDRRFRGRRAATERVVTDRAATDRADTERAVTEGAATERVDTEGAVTERALTEGRGSRPGALDLKRRRRGRLVPGKVIAFVAWFGASQRRTRRLTVVALVGGALLVLLPVTGGLPGGALRPEFHLGWPQVKTGLANSAVMTAGTLAGTLVMAVPAAYVLARGRFRGRSALFGLVLLAMAIPGALTLFPQAQGLLHLGLINTRPGVMLIYIAADLPLAAFFLRAAFAAVPEPLVEAMRVDGASAGRIAARLFLPLSASALVAVGILTVLQVLNDSLIMAVMTNNPSFYTLPVLVANGMAGTGALGASWLSIGPPLLLFVAFQRQFQRGVTSGQLL